MPSLLRFRGPITAVFLSLALLLPGPASRLGSDTHRQAQASTPQQAAGPRQAAQAPLVSYALHSDLSPAPAAHAPQVGTAMHNNLSPAPAAQAPLVSYALHSDLSPALAAQPLPAASGTLLAKTTPLLRPFPAASIESRQPGAGRPDPALQTSAAAAAIPTPVFNFEGLSNAGNHAFGLNPLPPDAEGDIGPNHYFQWVNLTLAIWKIDRAAHSATRVFGPAPANTIWVGFGGLCETHNDGDPSVRYDPLADRWVLSQFAYTTGNTLPGPFYQCMAVSQSGDPTGAWYRYAFEWKDGSNPRKFVFNDYVKLGVWSDGYYLSANQFSDSSATGFYLGAGVAVVEREAMLQGKLARMLYFDLASVNPSFSTLLPADLDGPQPPPGTPETYAEVDPAMAIPPQDALRLWSFHVDWNNPSGSTFGLGGIYLHQPNALLPVAAFTPAGPVSQPGAGPSLDAVSDRLMERLQYRHFPGYDSLVVNHSVDVGGRAGVRWYELRNSGPGWSVFQQGSYGGDPGSTENRWMGSAAQDSAGNIAIGYSVSGPTTYPSIRYSARLAGDPPGQMTLGEGSLIAGAGAQTDPSGRWGDYSMLSVDPLDDCTLWYTNEYLAATSARGWQTRIGAFTLPGCQAGAKGALKGTVTEATSRLGVSGAWVVAQSGSGVVYQTASDQGGNYFFPSLPAGSYTTSATAYSYNPAGATVLLASGVVTVQDFSLAALPTSLVSGVVQDASGHSWPLYARIELSAPGLSRSIYTDPLSGAFSARLVQGVTHILTATAFSAGYQSLNALLTPANAPLTQNISLTVNTAACSAPGYSLKGASCQAQPGGLVIGHVLDANTGIALNGAMVTSAGRPAESAVSSASAGDPRVGDGFYTLFSSLTGAQTFSAAAPGYGTAAQTINVSPGGLVSSTFNLPAGRLGVTPGQVQVTLNPTQTASQAITLTNMGGIPLQFSLLINPPAPAWLNLMTPISNTLQPGGQATAELIFNLAGTQTGLNQAALTSSNTGPYGALLTTVNLFVASYSLALQPAARGYTRPGGTITYTLQLTNTGNVTGVYSASLATDPGWTVKLPPSIGPVEPGGTTSFTVSLSMPPTAMRGRFYTFTLQAANQVTPANGQATTLTAIAPLFYLPRLLRIVPR